jgi:hypothetical protein
MILADDRNGHMERMTESRRFPTNPTPPPPPGPCVIVLFSERAAPDTTRVPHPEDALQSSAPVFGVTCEDAILVHRGGHPQHGIAGATEVRPPELIDAAALLLQQAWEDLPKQSTHCVIVRGDKRRPLPDITTPFDRKLLA